LWGEEPAGGDRAAAGGWGCHFTTDDEMRAILVPVDGSPLAEAALHVAIAIARREGARVEAVAVVATPVQPMDAGGTPVLDTRLEHDLVTQAEEYLAGLRGRLAELAPDVPCTASLVRGRAEQGIVAQAEREGHNLIVMTTHGRSGLSRLWMGSVASGVLRHSPIPVLLLRDVSAAAPREGVPIFPSVLVPLDADETSEQILADVIAVAGRDATVHLMHVVVPLRWVPPPSAIEIVSAGAEASDTRADLLGITRDATVARLNALADRLRRDGIAAQVHVPIHYSAAEAVLAYAHESGASLIAMTSHGRGAVGRTILGSVSDKVVRGATQPVLVRVPAAHA
jgi:nucleotide-binding universal stress UspA family protein